MGKTSLHQDQYEYQGATELVKETEEYIVLKAKRLGGAISIEQASYVLAKDNDFTSKFLHRMKKKGMLSQNGMKRGWYAVAP